MTGGGEERDISCQPDPPAFCFSPLIFVVSVTIRGAIFPSVLLALQPPCQVDLKSIEKNRKVGRVFHQTHLDSCEASQFNSMKKV